ncbi:Uncharacterised protein [Metamycoplasma arthritidis]|uniref:Hypothetical membrane protein n=2 Tax=Metamycoplasma arthritidis TaxID=2111 RepID=B3PML7_META1|nr:hypothetical protein [Metamycoplasma arthritidis]ACF07269.1 hypothetical membrane protein [Metamycoplasma arthritidis 158L3-1]VEU78792.1 Uncharacterised protein [Metamycoplasma arthritidis]
MNEFKRLNQASFNNFIIAADAIFSTWTIININDKEDMDKMFIDNCEMSNNYLHPYYQGEVNNETLISL